MMTEKETKQRQAAKPDYRQFVNPKQFNELLDGRGVLNNRQQIAEQFGYNWHARKLKFEPHFRGHVLLQATAYESTRDHQWAAAHDPLFATCGAAVQIFGLADYQCYLTTAIHRFVHLACLAFCLYRLIQLKEDTRSWLPPVPKGVSPTSFAHLRRGLQYFIFGRILSPHFGEIPDLPANLSELEAILRIAA